MGLVHCALRDEFNFKHRSTRIVVEHAFGRSKGMWRILSRTMLRPDPNMVGQMVFACCLLHNIIILQSDTSAMNAAELLEDHDPQYETIFAPVVLTQSEETL